VPYTHEVINVPKYSSRHPGEWKHLVGEDNSWRSVLCAKAFDAIRIDVYEQLPSEDELERPTP
jgi:hypothetical protein